MAFPKKRGVAQSLLFQVGIFLVFVVLIKGLEAGSIIEKSGGLLTGAAVYGYTEKTGVLEVEGDPAFYIDTLTEKGYTVNAETSGEITTIVFSGLAKKTGEDLLECAEVAGKKDQLVNFYLRE